VLPVVPLRLGSPESGAFVARVALFGGAASSIAAALFAFLHFWKDRRAQSSRLLLGWCGLLLLGFVILFRM